MSAMRAEVDPAAALELVDLVARQLKQLDDERPAAEVPLVVGFLAFGLEDIAAHRRLAAFDVQLLRDAAWRARRLDLVRAFRAFNPAFGPVHAGCWGPAAGRAAAAGRSAAPRAGARAGHPDGWVAVPPGW